MSGVVVDIETSGVRRAFGALRRLLGNLAPAWAQIGARMEDAAIVVTPVESGALVDSLRASSGPQSVDFGSSLIYAGVQDQGWPGHNIAGHHFMERAEDELRDRAALEELQPAVQSLIDAVGLS